MLRFWRLQVSFSAPKISCHHNASTWSSTGLVSEELEKLIRYLEPCGAGNPAPVFGVRSARAVQPHKVGTNHLRFLMDDGLGTLPAIGFQWADVVPDAWFNAPLDVAFRLERDDWQGRNGLQARVASLAPSTP